MYFPTTRPALAPGFTRVAAYAALLTLTGPVMAAGVANGAGDETITIAVRHIDRNPKTPAAANKVLRRLGDAALTACGGSSFSLAPVKDAIRSSACWRASMTRAVNEIGSPMVTQLYERNQSSRAG
jgi:UrcA family protein